MTTTTAQKSFPRHVGVRHPSVLVWLRLARVCQKIERRSEDQMRCHGLSMAQFDVLAHVGAAPGITQQELADSLLVTKGNVCQLLDRMQCAGLIERRQEGRANRLSLTAHGQAMFADIVPAHEEFIAQQISALSGEEQIQILDGLRKLDHALDTPRCSR